MTLTIERALTSVVSPEGRVVLPASLRKELGIKPGDTVTLTRDRGGIHITTREAALAELREMFREAGASGTSLVDELIAERRAEAARDDAEL